MSFIGVGQGDAVLVQSGSKNHLTDAGRSEESPNIVDEQLLAFHLSLLSVKVSVELYRLQSSRTLATPRPLGDGGHLARNLTTVRGV